MEPAQHWCEKVACADFMRVAAGNIKGYSYRERRDYGATGQRTVSADQGTFFETLRSAHHAVADVLALLMERNRLRAVERLRHPSHNAIRQWVE